MIFTTWAYAVFLSIAFTVYWLMPARARGATLTAFGFFFFAGGIRRTSSSSRRRSRRSHGSPVA